MDNSQPPKEEEKLLEAPEEEQLIEAPAEEKLIPAHTSHNSKGTVIKILMGIVGALILLAIAFTAYVLVADMGSEDTNTILPDATPTESVQADPTEPPPILDDEGQTICTMDAKICPDGSSVGRQGPDCEFTACPGE